ncbi:RING-CH-type domain-containing protein [Citrus sinensis]|uniref:RING-CH-type domain-containing protein n=1 Tax=Citrus sinensis TaxID=2711 RepID=A0ACB8LX03_CITSI|nr:RING-CH-type domain-containing protein [Citrus sinensis]
MSDHLVLCVDRLLTPDSLPSMQGTESSASSEEGSSSHSVDSPACVISMKEAEEHDVSNEEEPLIQTVECRICQEEDSIKNLEVPCSCSGSLKGKEGIILIILHAFVERLTCLFMPPYQPGYTAPPPPPQSEDTTIDIRQVLVMHALCLCEAWTVSGTPLDLHDPRLVAMAAAERHLLDAEYDEYADTNASGAAFCRSAALILMALLLLRHALTLTNSDDGEDDASTFFSLFLLRAAGFLLPCYIMAWAVSILQRRRQRQEAAALAATEVAFMIQAGQRRGLHFTIAPGPAVTPHQEPLQ